MNLEYSVVGKRLPRVDAKSKATGEAIYTIDMQLPRMLYGKILRSPHAHAKILHIDASRAEQLPGVKGVITWQDLKSEKKVPIATVPLFPMSTHWPTTGFGLSVMKLRR